jgi:hypothetical protein
MFTGGNTYTPTGGTDTNINAESTISTSEYNGGAEGPLLSSISSSLFFIQQFIKILY